VSVAGQVYIQQSGKWPVGLLEMKNPFPSAAQSRDARLSSLLKRSCIVAISLWNDADTRTLAETFGAHVLLDKMNLYSELIPAIKQFCPSVIVPEKRELLEEQPKRPASPSIGGTLDAA
jgi:hypothetical protein